jgi:peptidoglycan lytic transglycosylase G
MEFEGHRRIGSMAVAVLLVGTVLLFVVVQEITFLFIPPSGERIPKTLEIPEGTTLREAAGTLLQNGLITSVESFVIVGKLLSLEHRVIPGEYAFNTRMLPLEIIDQIKSGRVIQYEITIPEGFTMAQIARQVDEKGLARADDFIQRASDPDFVHSLGFESDTLEGYLYPESYYFSKREGSEGILRALTKRFNTVYTPEMDRRAKEIGMTRKEVITLASIIEKETSVDEERSVVSAVFHNRIRKNIPLQSDPTVIYALPHFDGNLTRRNLKTPSPYNTYHVKGLPPGPISNPGIASIMAALNPASVNYLYFVSRNDGTHHFSETLAEHNRAVQKYQRRRAAKTM